jgi:hypothetical protein
MASIKYGRERAQVNPASVVARQMTINSTANADEEKPVKRLSCGRFFQGFRRAVGKNCPVCDSLTKVKLWFYPCAC